MKGISKARRSFAGCLVSLLLLSSLPIAASQHADQRRLRGETLDALNQGNAALKNLRLPDALNYFNRALRLARASGDIRREAHAMANIGLCHDLRGSAVYALEYYSRARPLYESLSDSASLALLYANEAQACLHRSNFQRTRAALNMARAYFTPSTDPRTRVAVAHQEGNLAQYTGDYCGALLSYLDALSYDFPKTGDSAIWQARFGLELLQSRMGNLPAADEIPAFATSSRSHSRMARAFWNLALAWMSTTGLKPAPDSQLVAAFHEFDQLGLQGPLKQIRDHFLNWSRAGEDLIPGATPLLNTDVDSDHTVGNVALSWARIIAAYEDGRLGHMATLLGDGAGQVWYSFLVGRGLVWVHEFLSGLFWRAVGQRDLALQHYSRALDGIEGGAGQLLPAEALQAEYWAAIRQVYSEASGLLVELGHPNQALELLERGRGQSRRGAAVMRILNGSRLLVEQEGEVRDDIVAIQRELTLPTLESGRRSELRASLTRAESELLAHEQAFALRDGRFDLAPDTTMDVDAYRLRLPQDAVVLSYLLASPRSFVWYLDADTSFCLALPDARVLERDLEAYIGLLRHRPRSKRDVDDGLKRLAESGPPLAHTLLGPTLDRLSTKSVLYIQPDGLLHYLPFGALRLEEGYLLDRMAVVRLSAPRDLLRREDRPSRPARALIVANPSLEAHYASTKREVQHPGFALLRGMAEEGLLLGSLPFAQEEGRAVANHFQRKVLLEAEHARESTVKIQPLDEFTHMHFAAHILASDRYPHRSSIVLALNLDQHEDGLLQAREIAEMNLNAELVVLSGCESARGRLLPGQGVLGLVRAFQNAGARRVMASLWRVSDLSSTRLMEAFYGELSAGAQPLHALNTAARAVRDDGNPFFHHPFHWAAFVLNE